MADLRVRRRAVRPVADAVDRPRRVVFFINFMTRGGAEVQILRLAERLSDAGEDVTLLTIEPPRALEARLRESTVRSYVLEGRPAPVLRGPRVLVRAAAALRRLQPDVLVCAVYQATVLGRVAGRLAGVPVIVSSLRNEKQTSRLRDFVLRATARLDHWTTTNSRLTAESLTASGVVRPERLDVIPNALLPVESSTTVNGDGSGSRIPTRRALGFGDEHFLWLAVGRLEPQKDHATLIEAFRLLPEGGPHRLAIVGAGRLTEQIADAVTVAGLSDRVRLLGPRDDVPRLLGAADALVLCSRWEGLPNVIMEAMEAKLPVVATRVGGVPELVEDGVTGIVVEPGNQQALAAAMRRLGTMSPEELTEWGQRARARVHLLCDPDVVTRRWIALFDRLSVASAQMTKGHE